MRATLVARVLRRAILASLVSPTLVACGGPSSPEGSGTSGGSSGGGSGSASGGPLGATGGATGSSTTAAATTGSGQSGSVTSGTAQTGANSGAASGASSGSVSAVTGSGAGSAAGGSGSSASGASDAGVSTGRSEDASTCAILPDPQSGSCAGVVFDLVGSASACGPYTGGPFTSAQCSALCPLTAQPFPGGGTIMVSALRCNADSDGGAHLTCAYPCAGRRPEGLRAVAPAGPDQAARFLAQMAYLEAASVHAFEHLACELEAHRAPARLSRAARRAARDEIRHARVVGALAQREGGRVPEVRTELREVRSLEEIATENAIEGCVRETFGAAVAMIQAERAGDAHVRSTMKRIARDETRHAELSWAVARWIEPRLGSDGRRRVREAREQAIAALASDAAHEPDAGLTERLGVPSALQARSVLTDLKATLWS
jgi:hypothetical protein